MLQHDCSNGLKAVKWGMELEKRPTRMARISVQVSQDLQAGLHDLARREQKSLQPMLREILQAVVDGDDPGRVVSAGTREAIDALRNEVHRSEAARAQVLTEAIRSLQEQLLRDREEDRAERAALTAAFSDLAGAGGQGTSSYVHLLALMNPRQACYAEFPEAGEGSSHDRDSELPTYPVEILGPTVGPANNKQGIGYINEGVFLQPSPDFLWA